MVWWAHQVRGLFSLCKKDYFRASRWREKEQYHCGILSDELQLQSSITTRETLGFLEPKREFSISFFSIWQGVFFFKSFQGNLCISERKSSIKIYLYTAFSLMNASALNVITPHLIKILGIERFWFWKLLNVLNSQCLNVHLVFWEIRLASCQIRPTICI